MSVYKSEDGPRDYNDIPSARTGPRDPDWWRSERAWIAHHNPRPDFTGFHLVVANQDGAGPVEVQITRTDNDEPVVAYLTDTDVFPTESHTAIGGTNPVAWPDLLEAGVRTYLFAQTSGAYMDATQKAAVTVTVTRDGINVARVKGSESWLAGCGLTVGGPAGGPVTIEREGFGWLCTVLTDAA